jgi:type II secretion system protein N
MKWFIFSSYAALSSARTNRRGFYLGAAALFLAGLVAGFYLFFPADALRNRIIREASISKELTLEVEQLSLFFPASLMGRQLKLQFKQPPQPSLEISALTLKPLWTTLFTANPGISFSGELYGGAATGKRHRDGQTDLHINQLSFDVPVAGSSTLKITGEIETGHLSGTWPPPAGAETEISLILRQAALTGLDTLGAKSPSLSLGTLSFAGNGHGKSFKIERLDNEGGDLQITGSGTVLLAPQIENSRVNLLLTLTPRASFDRGLADLMAQVVKPRQDGAFQLRISGSPMNPRIN